MAQVVDFVEVPTADLGRWVKLQHVNVPVPLVAASFVDVPLAEHEWEQAVNVPDVTVANVASSRDVSAFPTRVGEVLLRLGHVCDSPEFSVFLTRSAGDRTRVSAAVSRGDVGVIVADLGDRTRLAAVPAGNMVAPLVGLQPRLTPADVPSVEFSERVRAEAARSTRPDRNEALLLRHGFSPRDVAELERVDAEATGHGVLGAFSLRGGTPVPSPVCADWVESPAGCTMRFVGRSRSHTVSGADRTSLSRAASAALAAARN